MPRHRRSRRDGRRPPAALVRAFALATVAAFVLPVMTSSSPGAPQPAAARIPSGSSVVLAPAPSLGGAVAGATGSGLVDAAPAPDPLTSDAAGGPAAPDELTGYRWPVAHPRVTLPFGAWRDGSRIVDGEPFHDGVDLATFCGDRVVAAHDGVVLAAGRHYDTKMGWVGDLGPYIARLDAKSLWTTLPIVVVVDDGNGYRSLYAHFGKIVVEAGDEVHAGQLLGYEGRTGHASGCHVHYGLFSPLETATFAIDPAVAQHMKLPLWEIARIDPLLVLPARPGQATNPPGSSGSD